MRRPRPRGAASDRELLDRLPVGLVLVDGSSGRVEFANRIGRELLGIPRNEIGVFLPEPWPGVSLRAVTSSCAAGRGPEGLPVTTPDGRRLELSAAAASGHVLLLVREVTLSEREAEEARIFVRNASHELRAPLSAIAHAADALRSGAIDDPDLRMRFLDAITAETERLTALAHGLLSLARAQTEADAVTRVPVGMQPLLRRVVRRVTARPGVELHVSCSPGVAASADRALLESAVLNLAQNAVRHTEHGHVVLSCRLVADGRIAIDVADTGDGIDPGSSPRIFDAFYRGDRSTGFGIGLSLARRIARVFGGDVTVRSRPGTGTSVRLTVEAVR